MTGLVTKNFSNLNPSLMGRLRNSLVNGIKDQKTLPKMVVIIPDQDIIDMFLHKNDISSYTWGKIIYWLMSEYNKIIQSYKEFLPEKAKRKNHPQFVWIEPPQHRNFRNNNLREKFSNCLRTMAKLCDNTSVLALKKIWDPVEPGYFVESNSSCLSSLGFKKYWEAIDHMPCYCDTTIMVKIQLKSLKTQKPDGNDRIESEGDPHIPPASIKQHKQWGDHYYSRFHWNHHMQNYDYRNHNQNAFKKYNNHDTGFSSRRAFQF